MCWYAAHSVTYAKHKEDKQDKQDNYPLWENVLLIDAPSDEEAMAKAVVRAKEDEGDSRGTFTWGGKPAEWCFAGIRKLIECEDANEPPKCGTEVIYLELMVDNAQDIERLVQGEAVQVRLG